MSSTRALLVAALAASLAACAGTKSMKPSTEVIDSVPAPEPAPAAEVAAPEPGACSVDADCGQGERCDAGRCALAPASTCELVRVAFAFDSAQLDPQAMGVLRDNARCVAERRAAAILIEGHADERGTVQYNVALGARRAEAVRRYFADLGVKAKLETVSFGEELPIVNGAGEGAWAQNRRAELRLPGERRSDGTTVSVQ
jgi:peptidoglycan-associated lipoprotein